jgi:hypothetical protein
MFVCVYVCVCASLYVVVVGFQKLEDGENDPSANFEMSATLKYKAGLNEGGRKPKQAEGFQQIISPAKKHLHLTFQSTKAKSGKPRDRNAIMACSAERGLKRREQGVWRRMSTHKYKIDNGE